MALGVTNVADMVSGQTLSLAAVAAAAKTSINDVNKAVAKWAGLGDVDLVTRSVEFAIGTDGQAVSSGSVNAYGKALMVLSTAGETTNTSTGKLLSDFADQLAVKYGSVLAKDPSAAVISVLSGAAKNPQLDVVCLSELVSYLATLDWRAVRLVR